MRRGTETLILSLSSLSLVMKWRIIRSSSKRSKKQESLTTRLVVKREDMRHSLIVFIFRTSSILLGRD